MCDVNTATILGRLTRDPDVHPCQSGIMATFTVAANYRRRTREGQTVDDVAFVPVVAFGPPADAARDYHHGDSVCVTGRLRTTSWERDGKKLSRLELVVDALHCFPASNGQAKAAPRPAEEVPAEAGAGQEKLPF